MDKEVLNLIHRISSKFYLNSDSRKDIVQEVSVFIYQNQKVIKKASEPKRFKLTILKNFILDFIRKNLKHEKLISIHNNSLDWYAVEDSQDTMVMLALDSISKIERKLIIDRFYFGFTLDELTKKRRTTKKIIRNRLQKALFNLKSHFN